MGAELGKPFMVEVDREELVSLLAIKRFAQAYLLSTDHQHEDQRARLGELLAEHYRRFELPDRFGLKGRRRIA